MGEGTTEANAGTWFGSPVIAGNGKAGEGGMNGWMATMLNADEETARKYFTALNSAIWMVRKLAAMLKAAGVVPIITPPQAVPIVNTLTSWGKMADVVLKDLDAGGTLSPVSIMGASELINIEGAVKGA
jgi:hypothetical protein